MIIFHLVDLEILESSGITISRNYHKLLDKIEEELRLILAFEPVDEFIIFSPSFAYESIIAREINMQAPLVVFMQPTRGLDIGAVMNVRKQIIAERDRGAAVLLISLDLDEIMDCADTIAVIYNGTINKIARASDLTVNEIGLYMMGVGKTA